MAIPAPLSSGIANWHWKNKTVTRWGHEAGFSLAVVGIFIISMVNSGSSANSRPSPFLGMAPSLLSFLRSPMWTEMSSLVSASPNSSLYSTARLNLLGLELLRMEYHWSLTTASSPEVDALYKLAKARLPSALETKFAEFAVAIVETHSKDVTVSADPSRSATPAITPTASSSETPAGAVSTPQPKPEKKKSNVNTTKITVEGSFMAAAADLFSLLTDEKRIPTWTRAPAKSEAKVDTEYSLFGGGVKGKYVSLTSPTEIVQTWALSNPSWPSGHSATLTTKITQGSDYSTVTFVLDGVPTGQEEEIKRNIEGYYIQGFKSIGYVQLYLSPPSYTKAPQNRIPAKPVNTSSRQSFVTAIVLATLVLFAAFALPYFSPRLSK
ncbi:Activator of Hsp90 ATPase [Mycena indigotica]|uniref:Activator of Hsp90 ATPase n=1 Tax=Mycena indigotica TaxID=2126181 RepID=A0A8H6WFV3_9AGAR|nr:Activator of Hsp90 ATPase [Mycena indigotica]KAF7315151.1 Activator of Hsp90 ATPase [Mycena indigotica]